MPSAELGAGKLHNVQSWCKHVETGFWAATARVWLSDTHDQGLTDACQNAVCVIQVSQSVPHPTLVVRQLNFEAMHV